MCDDMKRYGFNYMGSKNKLAEKIIDVIPPADNFYDLFCGGFAVSHCAMTYGKDKYQHVYSSDINSLVVDCVWYAMFGNTDAIFVTHEDFDKFKKSSPYIACCFSFGGDWRSYCYSKSVEPLKRALHNAIANYCVDDFLKLTGVDLTPILDIPNMRERRLMAYKIIREHGLRDRKYELEHLERHERLFSMRCLRTYSSFNLPQHKDYMDVKIQPNSVVYCDIPYQNTSKYVNGSFDYESFFDWCSKQTVPVYVSSYELPDMFECVAEFEHRSIKCAIKNNKVTERLFLYKK